MINYLTFKDYNPEHVEIIQYPDGQRSVKIDLDYFDVKTPIDISCRIKSFSDLEILSSIVFALIKNDRIVDCIRFTYLFGMRSDRAFSNGEPNYFRDVVAPMINDITMRGNVTLVRLFYPHGHTIAHIDNAQIGFMKYEEVFQNCILIFGDKSAAGQYPTAMYFDKVRSKEKIKITMSKENTTRLHDLCAKFPEQPIVILDDLCDGGATFIHEGKWLKEYFPQTRLHLFVAHGLFSKGFDEIFKYYDKIFTTNSYQDFPQNPDDPFHIPTEKLEVMKII